MSTGTMTSKGQITVPKDVREAMGLTPGTKVDFQFAHGQWVISAERRRAVDLVGILGSNGRRLTVEEMDDAIAEAAVESARL